MVTLEESGDVPPTVAPEEDWVTVMLCAPAASPLAGPNDAIPRAAPPEPIRRLPVVTTSSGDATVPAEICVEPVASWSTARVSEPLWVPELTVAEATEGSDELVA